jgi:hypothetical protein
MNQRRVLIVGLVVVTLIVAVAACAPLTPAQVQQAGTDPGAYIALSFFNWLLQHLPPFLTFSSFPL